MGETRQKNSTLWDLLSRIDVLENFEWIIFAKGFQNVFMRYIFANYLVKLVMRTSLINIRWLDRYIDLVETIFNTITQRLFYVLFVDVHSCVCIWNGFLIYKIVAYEIVLFVKLGIDGFDVFDFWKWKWNSDIYFLHS